MIQYNRIDNYPDKISRLFPMYGGLKINSGGCRQLTFQITDACNLACTYCYQINKHHNIMPFEIAKKVIDCLFDDNYKIDTYYDSKKLTGIVLDFIGGEPFLEIDLIDKICDYFIEQALLHKSVLAHRYRISLCSNGVLYFEPNVQRFINKWRNNLSLSISIDGCKELHDMCRLFPNGKGSYDIAIKAAMAERNINHDLSTKMTLAPNNISYLFKAVKNLVDLNYEQIYFNCVFEKGWEIKHAKELYNQCKLVSDYLIPLEKSPYISFFDDSICCPMSSEDNNNWCGGAGLMLAVDYKGDFYPCLRFMESSIGDKIEPYIIGNVFEGIGKTQTTCDKISCLDCITRRSQSTDECFNCEIAKGCAWCTGYNYQEFGTPNKRATYICIMHKARALANCYFWNNYFRYYNIKKRFKLWLNDEECLKIIDKDELEMLHKLEKEE